MPAPDCLTISCHASFRQDCILELLSRVYHQRIRSLRSAKIRLKGVFPPHHIPLILGLDKLPVPRHFSRIILVQFILI